MTSTHGTHATYQLAARARAPSRLARRGFTPPPRRTRLGFFSRRQLRSCPRLDHEARPPHPVTPLSETHKIAGGQWQTAQGATGTSTITQDQGRIVHEVKGPGQTSSVTQVPEKVTLKAKQIELDAETLLIKCSQNMSCQAGGSMSLASTGDMSLASQSKWGVQCSGAMNLASSGSFLASAVTDAKVSGQNANIEAQSKLSIKGGTDAEMSALKVAISGTAKADLTAPMTTVGQDLTTVKGTMV